MTDAYYPAANVPAGARDTSDAFGPTLTGAEGIEVPRAVFHNDQGGYVVHTAMTGDSSNPPPVADRDHDAELPDIPRYEGPSVPDQPALINPSAGMSSGAGGGVNPIGAQPQPGDLGPYSDRQVYPDTTQGFPR